jgi:hypothetical protein
MQAAYRPIPQAAPADQKEFKLVLFTPTVGHWAVDVYEGKTRVHCGRGWKTQREAMREATEWLQKNF